MACNLFVSTPVCCLARPFQKYVSNASFGKSVRCMATRRVSEPPAVRRSGNYIPNTWEVDGLESLKSDYTGKAYGRQAEKLKGEIKAELGNAVESLDRLRLVDTLERLGLGYHFEQEINTWLYSIYKNDSKDKCAEGNLYHKALEFRLLRQHGYHVPEDVFTGFKDEMGNFTCDDINGILCLYEASDLMFEGESILEEAWELSRQHLKDALKGGVGDVDPNLAKLVTHALEVPLQWRMPRLEARWFIDVYEKSADMNPILLEFAKLDFNIVQGIHLEELGDMLRWWKNIGFGEKLSFARDKSVEVFVAAVGTSSEPRFVDFRKAFTKVLSLINTMDDMYDIYGTLDELELFTDAIKRWDLGAMKHFPDSMQVFTLGFHNTIHGMAYDILKEQGINVLPNLKGAWIELISAQIVEARWYHNGYTPTMEEYMENAWASVAISLVIVTTYILATKPISEEELKYLESKPDLLRWACVICRLTDDLQTASNEMKRGDNPKSIQCYMNDTGASEAIARQHIRKLIRETWKKVNKCRVASNPLSQTSVDFILNLIRTTQSHYEHGDPAFENVHLQAKIKSLMFEPIPMLEMFKP